jgi:hypothetical protein
MADSIGFQKRGSLKCDFSATGNKQSRIAKNCKESETGLDNT